MADNIFQQAIGAAPAITQATQQASDLLQRVKAIASASAAQSLMHADLTTDDQRADWADDNAWHNLRSVFEDLVGALRHTPFDGLLRRYIVSVIQADELTAGLQALALTTAPAPPPPASPIAGGASLIAPETPPQTPPQSTEAVIVPPHIIPPHEDASGMGGPPHGPPPEPAPVSEPAAPQTFAQ